MQRRTLLVSLGTGAIASVAGCTGTGTKEQSTEPVRYFFKDETGALGHMKDEGEPARDEKVVTNTTTEEEYQELQTNDIQFVEQAAEEDIKPMWRDGLSMTPQQIIDQAEQYYNNPKQSFNTDRAETLGINLETEPNEHTFTRALIKATDNAGVTSSGGANMVVSNIAEAAVQQIQPGFNEYKLTGLLSSESIAAGKADVEKSIRETSTGERLGSTGFTHTPALLQYEKNGEQKVMYVEQTSPLEQRPKFSSVIREPEESAYRTDLEDGEFNIYGENGADRGVRLPEHYVTAFDYRKARELESQGLLGFEENPIGNMAGLGDMIANGIISFVDDESQYWNQSPDRNWEDNTSRIDGMVVSDSFGKSVEEVIVNPTKEKFQLMENVGRGIFVSQQAETWDQSVALMGSIQDPEILLTDHETVNHVRNEQQFSEDYLRSQILT